METAILLELSWAVTLTQSVNSKFSEKPCLKKLHGDKLRTPAVDLWPLRACVPHAQVCVRQIHVHKMIFKGGDLFAFLS